MTQLIFFSILINLICGLIFYRQLRRMPYVYFVQFIPLAIAGISALAQMQRAKKQKQAAKDALGRRNSALDAATQSTRTEANTTRYAGQDNDESNVRQGVADAFGNVTRSTRSSGDALNAAGRLQGSQQRAYQGIAATGQTFRQNAMDKYRQMLLRQAGVQDENRQYSETLKGAAAQNQYNGLQTALGGVAAASYRPSIGQYQQPAGWGNQSTFNALTKWPTYSGTVR